MIRYLQFALGMLSQVVLHADSQKLSMEDLKLAVHAELSRAAGKISAGFVIGSILIFSVLQLSGLLLGAIREMENATQILVIVLSATTLVCISVLFFIFRSSTSARTVLVASSAVHAKNPTVVGSISATVELPQASSVTAFDVQALGLCFAQGFIKGLSN